MTLMLLIVTVKAGTMSGDKMFYDKAIEIVDLLQGAFHTSRNRLKIFKIYTVVYSFKGYESSAESKYH